MSDNFLHIKNAFWILSLPPSLLFLHPGEQALLPSTSPFPKCIWFYFFFDTLSLRRVVCVIMGTEIPNLSCWAHHSIHIRRKLLFLPGSLSNTNSNPDPLTLTPPYFCEISSSKEKQDLSDDSWVRNTRLVVNLFCKGLKAGSICKPTCC